MRRLLNWLIEPPAEGRTARIFLRPLLVTLFYLSSLSVLWLLLGSRLVPLLAWLFLILSPLSFWVLRLVMYVYHQHPAEAAFDAENAVVVAIEVALIALVGLNILILHVSGLGTVPIATVVLLMLTRPAAWLISFYRRKW